MSIEQAVLERLRMLPVEKQQEVLDFIESLQPSNAPKRPRHSLKGLCADLGGDITEEEITEARREMWGKLVGNDS